MYVEDETWKQVKGFKGLYSVSNMGRVKTNYGICKEGLLKAYTRKNKYQIVRLYKKGVKPRDALVHRLVAEAFIDCNDRSLHVNHIDFNRSNNKVENLEYCTHVENMKHTRVNKKKKRGVHKIILKSGLIRYVARGVGSNDVRKYIGLFKTKRKAYQAVYDFYIKNYNKEPW